MGRDGKELLYVLVDRKLTAVPCSSARQLGPALQPLFREFLPISWALRDGQRFLVRVPWDEGGRFPTPELSPILTLAGNGVSEASDNCS
jgi:hypothetical protein